MPVYGYSSNSWIVGLLLSPTNVKGEFKRAGLFKVMGSTAPGAFETHVQDSRCHAKDEDYIWTRKDKYGKIHRILNLV
jgi:hypothetical protein